MKCKRDIVAIDHSMELSFSLSDEILRQTIILAPETLAQFKILPKKTIFTADQKENHQLRCNGKFSSTRV